MEKWKFRSVPWEEIHKRGWSGADYLVGGIHGQEYADYEEFREGILDLYGSYQPSIPLDYSYIDFIKYMDRRGWIDTSKGNIRVDILREPQKKLVFG